MKKNCFNLLFLSLLVFVATQVISCKSIPGCTDHSAFNYNPEANTDDGSCEPIVYGCMSECSENYNPNANTNNGSCILDRDKFLGVYNAQYTCYGAIFFDDTAVSNESTSITPDSLNFCKVNFHNNNCFITNDSIRSYYVYHVNGWIHTIVGKGKIIGDTIFYKEYEDVSGNIVRTCDVIAIRQ